MKLLPPTFDVVAFSVAPQVLPGGPRTHCACGRRLRPGDTLTCTTCRNRNRRRPRKRPLQQLDFTPENQPWYMAIPHRPSDLTPPLADPALPKVPNPSIPIRSLRYHNFGVVDSSGTIIKVFPFRRITVDNVVNKDDVIQPQDLRVQKLRSLVCAYAPATWLTSRRVLYTYHVGIPIEDDSDLESVANHVMQGISTEPVLRLCFAVPQVSRPSDPLANTGTEQRKLPDLPQVETSAMPQELTLSSSINTAVDAIVSGVSGPWTKYETAEALLTQAYGTTIHPRLCYLTAAPSDSKLVYGEVTPSFIHSMMQDFGITENALVVDLGSGVGNVVLQASLETGCRAFGCELDPGRHQAAVNYVEAVGALIAQCERRTPHFASKMHLKGSWKDCIIFKNTDLFADLETAQQITNADLIFSNNFKFGPDLTNRLRQVLANMKRGAVFITVAQIITGSRLSCKKTLSELGVTEDQKEHAMGASWTNRPLKYWVYRKTTDERR